MAVACALQAAYLLAWPQADGVLLASVLGGKFTWWWCAKPLRLVASLLLLDITMHDKDTEMV